jgi:cytochrome c biogenesis protein
VHAIHLSILIIFAGALLSAASSGFSAYVFLPEGKSTSSVFLQGSNEPVPLGFELRCDRFYPLYFTNTGGIIGERVDLTVLDPALAAPYQKSIMVNDPLTYRGLSFFKATAYPMEGYFVVIRNQATGQEQSFRVPADQDVTWPGSTVSFRIAEVRRDQDGVVQQAKIHLKADAAGASSDFWVDNNGTVITDGAAGGFAVSFRQLYTSLVLVTKDPGVWIVYLGSILMVVSLCICFLLSHWRMWVYVTPQGNRGSRILVSGVSNKNKPAFERTFNDLVARIQQDLHNPPNKKK